MSKSKKSHKGDPHKPPAQKSPSIIPENIELPDELPIEVRQIISAVISFKGPLPLPELLKGYDEIVPGSAKNIIGWVDNQRDHRQKMDHKVSFRKTFQTICGMIFGFFVAISGILGAIYLAMNNHEETAKVLGGFTLFAIVAIFVTGKIIKSE